MELNHKQLARQLTAVAQQAGCVEMEVYRRDIEVNLKSDNSPVTEADRLAENIILKALSEIAPDIPIISEEAASQGSIPHVGPQFFLVDPLDGTKEFVRKSDEFTINIALIEKGEVVFGLVYAPAKQMLFVTLAGNKAVATQLDPCGPTVTFDELAFRPIITRAPPSEGITVVASRSHMTDETRTYIDRFHVAELASAGSSLKFCLLAEGKADLYPRFGPTMEWDTAAGHAILKAAGGEVVNASGAQLLYGQNASNLRNPHFIAVGRRGVLDKIMLDQAN
ncbi:MAG: 3'(2'),5'-bisphosphate nucleotidase CysQ [Alphaproteobacteria bacterium]